MSLLTEHLDECGVAFEVIPHRRAFTSLQEARELGVAADEVLKTVALRSKGKYLLAVLPASRRLDVRLVRELLGDPAARLASEAELQADFPGYELGALPPLGRCWGSRWWWIPSGSCSRLGPRPSRPRSPPPSCSGTSRWPCCR